MRIKIISDPYNRKLSFQKDSTGTNIWEDINLHLDSKLRMYDEEKMFLPFKIKEIVEVIIDEYKDEVNKIELVFEGTPDEFDELERVCSECDFYEQISLKRGDYAYNNGRDIKNSIKDEFDKVYPIINSFVKEDREITDELKKVADALSDIVPICVIGNYSAGKSSFINALIGNEILPSGDTPVTAKVYEIKDSDQDDRAKISFGFRTSPEEEKYSRIDMIFNNNECIDLQSDENYELINDIKNEIYNIKEKSVFSIVYRVLELLTEYEKNTPSFTLIDNVINIEIPFCENGILARSKNKFVIFDTPGSNSRTNSDHEKVLQDALKGFSNGIPVWVCTSDQMDTNDNAELCEKLGEIKALDKRFTMIIANKADDADFDKYDDDTRLNFESVKRMYSSGIYYVSSLVGLGGKNEKGLLSSKYKSTYKKNRIQFMEPDDEFYTKLYEHNIMPEQMKTRAIRYSEDCSNLLYANSGLYCIEKEMNDFASKHSAYNKCMMVYIFLDTFKERISLLIEKNKEDILQRQRKWEAELSVKEAALVRNIDADTVELVNKFKKGAKGFIKSYQKDSLDYSRTTEQFVELASKYSEEESLEANYEAFRNEYDNVKNERSKNLRENRQNIRLDNLIGGTKELLSDLIEDSKRVNMQKESMNSTKRGIDSVTSDRLIQFVIEEYKNNIGDAQQKITESAEDHWKKNEESFKQEMIKLVVGSDALDDKNKEQLSDVIMNYKPIEFADEADKVFIKERFLKGNILGLKFYDCEKIDLRKLSFIYNLKIKQDISEMADEINESCSNSFKEWQEELNRSIKKRISRINPELYKLSGWIDDEKSKISELERNRKDIFDAIRFIESKMTKKEAKQG